MCVSSPDSGSDECHFDHRACYTRHRPFTTHVNIRATNRTPEATSRRPSADLITFGLETRLTWTGCRVKPVTAVSRAPERLVCMLGCVRYRSYPRIRSLRSMGASSLILALSALWTGPSWGQDRSGVGSILPGRVSSLQRTSPETAMVKRTSDNCECAARKCLTPSCISALCHKALLMEALDVTL